MPVEFTQLQLALLSHLRRQSATSVPINTISELLGVSTEAIEETLRTLERAGYQFIRSAGRDIALMVPPDRLYPHEISNDLQTRLIGGAIHYFETIDSTNDRAAEFARQGAPEGTLVVGEMQSAGKGRLSRSWFSPAHTGIYSSLILRPQVDPAITPGISLLLATAIAESINDMTDLQARIKWPNDVLIAGRKTAGILADLAADSGKVRYLVIGFGINVNQVEADFPANIGSKATSIRVAAERPLNRVRLLQQILVNFEKRYLNYLERGLSAELPAIKALSSVLMKRIRFENRGVQHEGTAVDMDEHGMLLVDVDGAIYRLAAGEITLQGSY